MGINMLKLRRPAVRLNFNIQLPILIRRKPNIDMTPRCNVFLYGQWCLVEVYAWSWLRRTLFPHLDPREREAVALS